jgi:hypothetical protein
LIPSELRSAARNKTRLTKSNKNFAYDNYRSAEIKAIQQHKNLKGTKTTARVQRDAINAQLTITHTMKHQDPIAMPKVRVAVPTPALAPLGAPRTVTMNTQSDHDEHNQDLRGVPRPSNARVSPVAVGISINMT